MTEDVGVSQRAISTARMLDRLEPGSYSIELIKPGRGSGDYWTLEINTKKRIVRKTVGELDSPNSRYD